VKDLQPFLAELRRLQPQLKARYPVRGIGVFGSYARGEQTPDSDLDLLVDLGPGLTLIDVGTLELELRDSLGVPVELAIKDALEGSAGALGTTALQHDQRQMPGSLV
jgi:hypothetical protein